MDCLSNLSSPSLAAASKLTPSHASPSRSPSHNDSATALRSPRAPPRTSPISLRLDGSRGRGRRLRLSGAPSDVPFATARPAPIGALPKADPLKIMISGAPASGKGTQCETIKEKYGLVHIAAGDLLRAEIAAGTENGKRAKEYMEKGMLAPDEIVVMMVKERLLQPDAQENGWLLDGYPRSLSQAKALEDLGIRPDLFILLDVSEESLVERVVGRRLDPVTGRIYHLKYSPPENEEIAARLTQRFDDTEEKVKLRLQTHHKNVEDVLSVYEDVIFKVDGDAPKEEVFAKIDNALSSVLDKKSKPGSLTMSGGVTASTSLLGVSQVDLT